MGVFGLPNCSFIISAPRTCRGISVLGTGVLSGGYKGEQKKDK